MYLYLAHEHGDRVAWWAVAILIAGIAGAAYASSRRAAHRRQMLGVCDGVLRPVRGWRTLF